jgi:hypothetical protein
VSGERRKPPEAIGVPIAGFIRVRKMRRASRNAPDGRPNRPADDPRGTEGAPRLVYLASLSRGPPPRLRLAGERSEVPGLREIGAFADGRPHSTVGFVSRPIACELHAFDAATFARYQVLRAQLDLGSQGIEEQSDGYVVVLPGDDATLALVAEWLALERRCCPFLAFSVTLAGPEEPIRVKLSGDADVKQFLAAELGSRFVPATQLVRPNGPT